MGVLKLIDNLKLSDLPPLLNETSLPDLKLSKSRHVSTMSSHVAEKLTVSLAKTHLELTANVRKPLTNDQFAVKLKNGATNWLCTNGYWRFSEVNIDEIVCKADFHPTKPDEEILIELDGKPKPIPIEFVEIYD